MKKFLVIIGLIFFVVVSIYFIRIPEYVELNNLIIVEGIGVSCNDQEYKLFLKEIIPTKNDNGISYKYKIYNSNNFESIKKAYQKVQEGTSKKIFYKDAKYIITDCDESKEIIDFFKINPNYIEHTTEDVQKKINKK